MAGDAPLLSVAPTKDGLWRVNERGPSRIAVAYFPSQWGAMRHALRVARAKRRCRVAILEDDGAVRLSRRLRPAARARGRRALRAPGRGEPRHA